MRKSLRQRLAEERRGGYTGMQLSSIDELYKLLVDGDRPASERVVNPTQLAFWNDPSFAKSYGGPAGCAKTSTIVAECIVRAIMEPGSKMLVARNDYNDLKDTTKLRFEEMIARPPRGPVGDKSEEAPATVWLQPAKYGGTDPDMLSTITFMGLKGGLGSYEFTGAVIDEADECSENSIEEVKTRLRHKHGTRYYAIAFNPPSKEHWLYRACTGKDAHDEVVATPKFSHHRPNPRENQRNLPADYYDNMANLPEDMRQRLRDGEWGSVFPGDPVIRQFSRKLHTGRLKYEGGTLFRFWDFGFNRPYCCFAQVSKKGHIHVLREVLGFQQEGKAFVQEVLKMTAQHFPNAKFFTDYGDPAVAQKKDTGSMLKLLADAGVLMGYQRTPFDLSMRALRTRFETILEREPAIVIDDRAAPILVAALAGGYHLKPDGVTPAKDGYYDHPVDALRYGVWNLFGVASTSTSTTNTVPDNIAYWSTT